MDKNEHGYAMILTIFAILLVSVIGMGMITVSSNSLKTSKNEHTDQSVYYVAEAGVNFKNTILQKKIQTAYEQAKLTPQNFDTTFNNQLKTILLTEASSPPLTNDFFKSTRHGEAKANVTVEFNEANPRTYKIISVGTLGSHTNHRTVERTYTIPNDILSTVTYEKTKTPQTPSEPTITEQDYSKLHANNYVDERLFIDWTPANKLNATFHVPFSKTINLFKLRVFPSDNDSKVKYKYNLPDFPKTTETFVSVPSTPSTSDTLTNKTALQTISKNFSMPKLSNFSNSTLNLEVKNGTQSVVFKESFLNYNLASVLFNVTGSGTLNLIFEKSFVLNVGRKFIINAPNTKVNLIFRDNATIRGELFAQNIFVKEGHFESTITSKLVADNVYIEKGNFDKDFDASVQVKNVFIKKGNLTVSGSQAFNADHITLQDGNIRVATGGKLIAKNIYVEDGELNSLATSCLQADTISVPKGDVRVDERGNFKNLFAETLYTIISSEINRTPCKKASVTITPNLPGENIETETITEYKFNYDSIFLSTPLVETK